MSQTKHENITHNSKNHTQSNTIICTSYHRKWTSMNHQENWKTDFL